LLKVDVDAWLAEVPMINKHIDQFGDRLPDALLRKAALPEEQLLKAKN
jgi:GTP-dependent phosphoenolpyruvate carboxykinase